MYNFRVFVGLGIAAMLAMSVPAFAEETQEKVVKTLEFDTLMFTQAGKRLFTHEIKRTPFPITLEFTKKSIGFIHGFSREKNDIEITYRVFPGALLNFVSMEDVVRKWREVKQHIAPYSFHHVTIEVNSYFSSLYNNKILDDPAIPHSEKENIFFTFPRLVFTSVITISNQSEYERTMQWFDAIYEAIRLEKPVVITFLFKPQGHFFVAGNNRNMKAYLSSSTPQSPTGIAHTVSIDVDITDINVDK
jgi:hypothetical protein